MPRLRNSVTGVVVNVDDARARDLGKGWQRADGAKKAPAKKKAPARRKSEK